MDKSVKPKMRSIFETPSRATLPSPQSPPTPSEPPASSPISRESNDKPEPTWQAITTGLIMRNSHGFVGGLVARIGARSRHLEMLSELRPELAPCE